MPTLHVCKFTRAALPRGANDAEVMHFERQLEHALKNSGHDVNWLPAQDVLRRQELNGPDLEEILDSFVKDLLADNTGWASDDYRIWNR